jgi:hypothetical protein
VRSKLVRWRAGGCRNEPSSNSESTFRSGLLLTGFSQCER